MGEVFFFMLHQFFIIVSIKIYHGIARLFLNIVKIRLIIYRNNQPLKTVIS